jgi:outer membrane receptor protein involved in Fe transport
VAFGGEYRKETTSADLTEFGDRTLFGNGSGDLAETKFDVSEGFIEANMPILKDMFLAQSLELSGAARVSDYSTIGQTDTWSAGVFWRINEDIAFRATRGTSVRAPTIDELFSPASQTFPSLTDGCSQPVINATTDATIRANRIRNCAQIGIPVTYVDPAPTVSNTGRSGSNPLLLPEESDSSTISAIYTPSQVKGLSFVVDYYDIRIENAISTLSAQTLLNLCTDSDAFNGQACGVFTRAAAGLANEYEVIDFIEGPFNFAGLVAKGIDFEARYGFETASLFGKDVGRIDLGVSGNYLIRRQNFTNPSNPDLATNIDTTLENPRVRLRTSATWTGGPLSVSWKVDFQEAQELVNPIGVGANTDTRDVSLWTTEDFFQHDLSIRYEIAEGVVARGGVTNMFDAEPTIQAGLADIFDLYGRRFFAGLNISF